MSNTNGLISAYILDGKGGAKAIDWQGVQDWSESDGVLWVHLDYTEETSADWLKNKSGLDEVVVSAMLSEDPRPRSTSMLDGLLVMMRGVNMNVGANPEDMVSLRLWLTEKRIITTRRRKLLSINDICVALEKGRGPATAGEFLVAISERLVDRMSDVVSGLDDKIDLLDDQIVNEKNFRIRSQISVLRREAISLRRYLAPQREAMIRLHSERVSWLSEPDRMRLREVADSTMRYIEDLDAVREKAIVLQEELMSGISEFMNKRMYVLSILSAIFLPLGFLTGLLGVNVAGIPGAEYKGGFLIFCVILFVVVIFQVVLFRKMKWM